MSYLLDTDHISLAQRKHPQVMSRILTIPAEQLMVSIVTVQEQMRGRLAQIQEAKKLTELSFAYNLLHQTISFYNTITIADFNDQTGAILKNLLEQKIRIGTLDLRIASIALSLKAILVTRNQRDFEKVPGLQIEDWTF
jgi:tRNA(fMet)-specific endonuclease VapC